jgi:hypothetical protein
VPQYTVAKLIQAEDLPKLNADLNTAIRDGWRFDPGSFLKVDGKPCAGVTADVDEILLPIQFEVMSLIEHAQAIFRDRYRNICSEGMLISADMRVGVLRPEQKVHHLKTTASCRFEFNDKPYDLAYCIRREGETEYLVVVRAAENAPRCLAARSAYQL